MLPLLITAFLVHPVHETVSEIEWNAETKRLEVAMRLDVLDEQWLKKKLSQGGDDVSAWAIPYLRQKFRVAKLPAERQRDSTSYRWIGRGEEGSHVWWYFEIEPTDQQRPTWIQQRTLLEREDNYTNRILILDRVPRRSLTLTIERPKANLDRAVNEPNASSTPPADRRSRLDR